MHSSQFGFCHPCSFLFLFPDSEYTCLFFILIDRLKLITETQINIRLVSKIIRHTTLFFLMFLFTYFERGSTSEEGAEREGEREF